MCLDSTHQVQSPSSIPLDSHYHDASAATTKHTARLLPVISPPLSLKASSRQPPMPCLIVEQTPAPVSFSMTCPTRHEKNTSAALTTVTGGAGTPPEGSASGRRPTLVLGTHGFSAHDGRTGDMLCMCVPSPVCVFQFLEY